MAPGAAHGGAEELGVALADADGELVPAGAGAPDAAEFGAADALLLAAPGRNGLNTSTVSRLGLCRKFIELMATAPKFGSGVIT